MRNNQRHYPRTPGISFRNVKLYVIHGKPVKEENGANIRRFVMLAGGIILGLEEGKMLLIRYVHGGRRVEGRWRWVSVRGWKELKEALRDEGLGKEQMRWFEQARRFGPTGCGNGRKISWAKDKINQYLGKFSKSVAGSLKVEKLSLLRGMTPVDISY